MEIGKYETLLKVAELGSLTRAAEELGYTQSAVSRIVADLERTWGVALLTRGHTGVTLSGTGEALLPDLRAVCNADRRLNETVAALHGLTQGTLRVGTITSISVHWLPGIIKTFQEKYPDIQFQLVSSIEYAEIADWIDKGRVDCGFVALPTAQNLDAIPLRRDRLLAVLPLDHPLAGAECFPLERCGEEPFVKLEDDRDREMMRIFDRRDIRPNIRYTVNDDYAVISMVENGLGVSILPELVLRRTPYRVVTLPLDQPEFRDIGLATRHAEARSPAAVRFLAHVRQWVGENA